MPVFEFKEHLFKFEMMVNKNNKRSVHHSIIYECDDDFVPTVYPFEHECGDVDLDENIKNKCQNSIVTGWAMGGNYVNF